MKQLSSALRLVMVTLVVLLATGRSYGQAGLVISQIYGGGGNSGATFSADFIEIYNPTSAPISTAGLSVQYASATVTGFFTQALALPSATIQPGHYFLVQTTTASTTVGVALPTPDALGTAPNLSATAGKVALVNGTAALSGDTTCAAMLADTAIIDLVGYGSTASCFKGTAPAPGPSTTNTNTQSIIRTVSSINTNNNSADFSIASPPTPRNSSVGGSAGSLFGTGAATPASLASGATTLLTVAVTPATSPASTGIAVTATLTGIGGAATQQFYDDGTHGDVTAGDNIFSFSTTATVATSGTVSLPASISDAQLHTATASISLTVNVPAINLAIHDIQGPKPLTGSTVSPYVGQQVTTTGVVTAVLSNGFFMQARDVDADSDPSTPEGIDVFTSAAPPAAAVVGNYVSVTGKVATFPAVTASHTPATELTSPTVTLISAGATLPTPVTLTASMLTASGGLYQLTRYEGMRVATASMTSISGTDGSLTESTETTTSNGRFYAVIGSTARPFREPGIDIRDALVAGTPANVAHFDDNPERILVDSSLAGGTAIDIPTGTTLANVTGVLDLTFSADSFYDPSRLVLDAAYNRAHVTGIPAVRPVATPASNEFTVVAYNVERFFDTSAADNIDFNPVTGKTETSSAVNITAAAYQRRLQKVSLAIRNVLNSPDIVALEEVENQSVVSDIAAQISADAVTAGQTDPKYVAYGTGTSYAPYTNDIGGISVGFLVKSNTVNTVNVQQYGANDTFSDPRDATGNTKQTLNDRPPLVLHAGVKRANAKDYPITVIVNHLRSLSGETDPASGLFVRAKKELQAEYLAKLMQSFQASGEHIVSLGDYNVFEFSDGYLDVMATATGNTPLPPDQVLLPGVGGLLTPAATDMVTLLPANQRWSYVEFGNAQVLDHLVATADLVGSSHIVYAHIDSDYPLTSYNDATTPARSSDHDPVVGYFAIPAPVLSGKLTPSTTTTFASTTIGASSAGQQFVFTNTGEGPVTITGVTATGDYQVGTTCNNASVTIGSTCNVNVVFAPTATGTRAGTVTFATNISGSTFSGALTGTGVAPPLPTMAPGTLDFGSVILNASSAAKTFTVTNTAVVPVAVSSVAVTGDYSQTNTCGTSVAASSTCTISVVFKPTAGGSRSGTVTVTTAGAAATTLSSTLTGTGLVPDFTLGDGSGASTTSLTLASGATGTVSLTFTAVNGYTGTISLTCTPPANPPLGVTCTAPGTFTLSGTSTTQTVTFATTARFFSSSGVAGSGGWALSLGGLIGVAGLGMLFARRKYRLDGRMWAGVGMLLLALAVCLPMSGCSSSLPRVNPNGTVAGTYPYTVTATSGSLVHKETVNLIVQ